MKMRLLSTHLAIAAVGALAALGCTQSPTDDPVVQKQFKRIDSLASDMDQLKRQLSSVSAISTDFQKVSRDLAELKRSAGAGVSAADVQGLQARLTTQETTLKTIGETLESLQSRLAPSPVVVARSEGGEAAKAEAKTEAKTETKDARTALESTAASAEPAGPGKAKRKATLTTMATSGGGGAARHAESPRAAGGAYHFAKAGETFDSLAAQFKVPAMSIRTANGVPQRSRLVAGQAIFIPAR